MCRHNKRRPLTHRCVGYASALSADAKSYLLLHCLYLFLNDSVSGAILCKCKLIVNV